MPEPFDMDHVDPPGGGLGWRHVHDPWIVFADAHLLVVDKPAGMPAGPGGTGDETDLTTRLRRGLPGGGDGYVGLMQPVDRLVSGLVLYSRDRGGNPALAAQLEAGVSRTHLLGVTDLPALRRALPAGARLRVVSERRPRALVELTWGARAQPLRRLLARAGVPVAGDADNGGATAPRLLMHSTAMCIAHPVSGLPLELSCPAPPAFEAWLGGGEASLPADLVAALRAAADRRYALGRDPETTAFRLVNDAGDGLPGVTLDAYGDFVVLSLRASFDAATDRALVDACVELGARGVYLVRPPKQASVVDASDPRIAPSLPVAGESAPSPLLVRERGLRFEVRLGDGLATGLFTDQRAARGHIRELARGRRFLNLFGYTGSFTVAAACGGASASVTVDASAPALRTAARNLRHNQLHEVPHRLVQAEARAWLGRTAEAGERFDLLVLDPPSYSTAGGARFVAVRDYQAMATLALRCAARGAVMLACTNHRGIDPRALRQALAAAARDAGHTVERFETLPVPSDYPVAPGGRSHLTRAWLRLR